MALDNPGYLADTLQALVDHVCACLEEDTVDGAPEFCFVNYFRPPDDCCNFLAVWVDKLQNTTVFPTPNDVLIDRCDASRMATVRFKLVRPCWPIVQPPATFPPPAEMQAASEKLLVDAEVLTCCLQGLQNGDVVGCGSFKFVDIIPDEPRGGCAGYTATVMVELDPCC